IKSVKLVGDYNRKQIAAKSAATGKPPAMAAWKKKINGVRSAYQAAQAAQSSAANSPADKRDAAQKEAARLMDVDKAAEAALLKVAALDAEAEIADYVARQEKESGNKFERT